MKDKPESIYAILRHMDGVRILYDKGILTADEFNSRVLEYINRARGRIGVEPLTEIPDAAGKP